MFRMSSLVRVLVATSFSSMHACADAPATKLPTDDELKANIEQANTAWIKAAQAYTDCLSSYAEKAFKTSASAGDIADGAASACSDFAFK
jgi:hypothetical protein